MANTTGMKFGGRKKGTPNKSTAEIRALAREYGAEAIRRLVSLMRQRDDRKVQLAAAKELLDRGYGPPKEVVEASDIHTRPPEEISAKLKELVERIEHRAARATLPVIRPSGELQIGSKV
jgi:hypothetical protein